jgi:IS1 family transposase
MWEKEAQDMAYHRESREIVAYVWGKRDGKAAKELRNGYNGWG